MNLTHFTLALSLLTLSAIATEHSQFSLISASIDKQIDTEQKYILKKNISKKIKHNNTRRTLVLSSFPSTGRFFTVPIDYLAYCDPYMLSSSSFTILSPVLGWQDIVPALWSAQSITAPELQALASLYSIEAITPLSELPACQERENQNDFIAADEPHPNEQPLDLELHQKIYEDQSLKNYIVLEKSQSNTTSIENEQIECNPGPGSRVAVGYRGPEGFGYDDGYTTLSAFLTPTEMWTFQPFLDVRGHVFNDGHWAANAGLGGRVNLADTGAVLGLNLFYDYRDTKELGSQHQVGAGLELLSQYADFRINGYGPVGDTAYASPFCFAGFGNCGIFVSNCGAATLADIDAEVGFYVPGPFRYVDLYIAGGPYYLFKKTECNFTFGDAWGGRARISLRPWDGILIGADITHDPIYNTKAQGWITLSFPFGPANMRSKGARFKERFPAPCDETAALYGRMTQPVYRNEIIPVEEQDACTLRSLCGLRGRFPGFPLFPGLPNFPILPTSFVFVNNTAAPGGNGSFVAPYDSLIAAEQNAPEFALIYVFPGDGTTTNYDQGFVFKPNQLMVSSATPLPILGIVIPPLTPGVAPTITNNSRQSDGDFFDLFMATNSAAVGFNLIGTQVSSTGAIVPPGASNTFFVGNTFLSLENGIKANQALDSAIIPVGGNIFSEMASDAINFTSPLSNSQVILVGNSSNEINSSFLCFSGTMTNNTVNVNNNFITTNMSGRSIFTSSTPTHTNNTLNIESNTFSASGRINLFRQLNGAININNNTFISSGDSIIEINLLSTTSSSTIATINGNIMNNPAGTAATSVNDTNLIMNNNSLFGTAVTATNQSPFACIDSNTFQANVAFGGSSTFGNNLCIHLNNNSNPNDYVFAVNPLGGAINLEAPEAPNNNFAGVKSINNDLGTFTDAAGPTTFIPIGGCGCP